MLLLLDTTAVSEMIRGNPRRDARLSSLPDTDLLLTSTIVRGEILFGIERLPLGKRRDTLLTKANSVLAQLGCEAIAPQVADRYALIKSECEQRGVSLNDNDIWIAAAAITLGAKLISQDQDFARVPGLDVKDWTR